jgi:hypothetical protein
LFSPGINDKYTPLRYYYPYILNSNSWVSANTKQAHLQFQQPVPVFQDESSDNPIVFLFAPVMDWKKGTHLGLVKSAHGTVMSCFGSGLASDKTNRVLI